jgi:hypothetical protein
MATYGQNADGALIHNKCIFLCPHPMLGAKCEAIIIAPRKNAGPKHHIPRAFLDVLSTMMADHFNTNISPLLQLPLLRTALNKTVYWR